MKTTSRSTATLGVGLLVVVLLPLGLWSSRVSLAQEGKAPPAKQYAYVGSKKCKKCHRKQFKSWEKTKMAKSFGILAPGAFAKQKTAAKLDPKTDYRKDKACLVCHTVGLDKQGGFNADYDLTKDKKRLLGVGCESCHGPGGAYLGKGFHDRDYKDKAVHEKRLPGLIQRGYVPKPAEESCKACHNEKSPSFKEFDYEKRKKEGVHEHFKAK